MAAFDAHLCNLRLGGRYQLHCDDVDGLPDAWQIIEQRPAGETLEVPSDKSILQVLRDAGHDIDYSCGEGTCGTCILDVLGGAIDHRDSVLTDEEKGAGDCICVCVSRAAGRLILDL